LGQMADKANGIITSMLTDTPLPKMAAIRQRFDGEKIASVESEIARYFRMRWVQDCVKHTPKIGITVGSRGIANLREIVRAMCEQIKAAGSQPFILPSMGSHGSATAEGQTGVLEELGVTEEYCGAPTLAGMDVVQIGEAEGVPVYYDKLALSMDGVIVLNRVKAHTEITGNIESGIHKMIAVGLGNHVGAMSFHAQGLDKAVHCLKAITRFALQNANILFAVAFIENAYEQTARIVFIPKGRIMRQEPALLARSKELLPRFPFNDIDVLVVDRIGKNISGDGMDPNVIGRSMVRVKNKDIRISHIVALDLTKESMGSGMGIGLADVTTRRLVDKIDLQATYINAITSMTPRGTALPPAMPNDRLAIQLAIKAACDGKDMNNIRMVRIRDTLHMAQMLVSPAILEELRDKPDITLLQEAEEMSFDAQGNLNNL
jgi:hypothetical protein